MSEAAESARKIADDTLHNATGDPDLALARNKRAIEDAQQRRQWRTAHLLEDARRILKDEQRRKREATE